MKKVYYIKRGKDGKVSVLKGVVVYFNSSELFVRFDGAESVLRILPQHLYNIENEEGLKHFYDIINSNYKGEYFTTNPYTLRPEELEKILEKVERNALKVKIKNLGDKIDTYHSEARRYTHLEMEAKEELDKLIEDYER